MRRFAFLLAALGLASCADLDAYHAQVRLHGLSQPELLACAGVPDAKIAASDNEGEIQYKYENDSNVVSLQATASMAFSLGGRGSCQAIFKMVDGKVDALHFIDNTWSFLGRYAACAPMVDSCLRDRRRDRKPLPSGFKPMAIYADK